MIVQRWRGVVLSARRLLARVFAAALGSPLFACSGSTDLGTAAGAGPDAVPTSVGAGAAPSTQESGATDGAAMPAVVLEPETTCQTPDPNALDLGTQRVDARQPVHRVLYSWTTAEQEAGLREGAPLFSVGVVEGKGRGIALDLLFERAESNPDSIEARLSVLFDKARYAWPNPWATRMGFGSEDYGNRLLKIVLREDAWIAHLSESGTVGSVWDLRGTLVNPEDVAANPEQIGAFFFVRGAATGGPECGSFLGGSGGYREFVLGNVSMVESYEVGTQDTLDRLDEDIRALTEYFDLVRPCPSSFGTNFNAMVFCSWGYDTDPYIESLALPDEAYVPTPVNLATIIQTLTQDRFTPDPFVVTLE